MKLSLSNVSSPEDRATLKAAILGGKVDVFQEASDLVAASSINDALTRLEALVKEDRTLGELGLVGLYPLADKAFFHDVCERVEQWLFHRGTTSVAVFLERLAESDSPIAAKADAWLTHYAFADEA